MELLILMAVAILFIILTSSSNDKKMNLPLDKPGSKIFGVCPPHKWYWVEVKDEEDTVVGHYINCERCGPLRNIGEEV